MSPLEGVLKITGNRYSGYLQPTLPGETLMRDYINSQTFLCSVSILPCFACVENVNKCHSVPSAPLYCILTLFDGHRGVTIQLMRGGFLQKPVLLI